VAVKSLGQHSGYMWRNLAFGSQTRLLILRVQSLLSEICLASGIMDKFYCKCCSITKKYYWFPAELVLTLDC
jgi:hypothetical protein